MGAPGAFYPAPVKIGLSQSCPFSSATYAKALGKRDGRRYLRNSVGEGENQEGRERE